MFFYATTYINRAQILWLKSDECQLWEESVIRTTELCFSTDANWLDYLLDYNNNNKITIQDANTELMRITDELDKAGSYSEQNTHYIFLSILLKQLFFLLPLYLLVMMTLTTTIKVTSTTAMFTSIVRLVLLSTKKRSLGNQVNMSCTLRPQESSSSIS